jgi:hypothetical protein
MGRGNLVLLLRINLDGKIDRGVPLYSPLHLRNWAPDVKTDSLNSAVQSAKAREITERNLGCYVACLVRPLADDPGSSKTYAAGRLVTVQNDT